MEWVKEFYNKQYELLTNNPMILTLRDDLVDKMEELIESKPEKILELGAGTGQFAVAAAKRGYEVTVIELAPKAIEKMRTLARDHNVEDTLHIYEGDFYETTIKETFDCICYWDGFGIGTDTDQTKLLQLIGIWLNEDGQALIDCYTPWYWANTAGIEMSFDEIMRLYDFDPYHCRMIDTWWSSRDESQAVTQSLRCYSPADLELLLKESTLFLDHSIPGGAMDYTTGEFNEEAPLHRAMSYTARLKKDKS
ncbi:MULTISPECIES: class I SAM-dependent methyltransferase [Pontibacillus]|uniref:Class I SAM-dependent methyltransferase n=1 Tax=Pontibacillus chungwhensis TaxID=265426 RepID=A0ABY8UU48_9BACI|nr:MULTISPECIES: class I SAM-dependent methyltransferase [Pontibacillus]MCD5323180.1 class I SAM-dependent methyltransferase [Pontibacillus sp. HN14]WIF96567.1 class I SAM-dependent methyltransferase [Pontibacillus chungwhensis]